MRLYNDSDLWIVSLALACWALPVSGADEICFNARDDDADGKVDCADVDCCLAPACAGLPCERFRRGDVDADGAWTVLDAIRVFMAVTESGSRLECADSADFDDDGTVQLLDGVLLLRFIFAAGAAPPEPYPGCGSDPTTDGAGNLGCGFEFGQGCR